MTGHTPFIMGIIVGIMLSCIFLRFFIQSRNIGDIRMDCSDPDSPPFLFLEIRRSKRHLIKGDKYVIARIKTKNYISQK